MGNNVLIIVPHADDEELIAQPFLEEGNGNGQRTYILYTSLEDHPSSEMVTADFETVKESIVHSNLYFVAGYLDREKKDQSKATQLSSIMDDILERGDEWTVVTTSRTYHPAHTECNTIARQLLRPKTRKKIKLFLEAPPNRFDHGFDWNYLFPFTPLIDRLKRYDYKLEEEFKMLWRQEIMASGGFTYRVLFERRNK